MKFVDSNMDYYRELMDQTIEYGPTNDLINEKCYIAEKLFSEEECDRILRAFEDFPTSAGTVDYAVDQYLRKCYVTYAEKTPKTEWFLNRIENTMWDANNRIWKFDVRSFDQPPRLMTYFEGDHFHATHSDVGPGKTGYRKLTSITFLSKKEDYEGGNFILFGEHLDHTKQAQGNTIIFPAYLIHCVEPVLAGRRDSLVHRACGPVFK